MKLTILGSGTCLPHKNRNSPGYYLEIAEDKVLIDPGSGTLHRLGNINVEIGDITLILFSHSHVDHTADLIPFLFAKRNLADYFENNDQNDISLFGYTGFRDYFYKLKEIYGSFIISDRYEIKVEEIENRSIHFNKWRLQVKKVDHSAESVGFRFTENFFRLTYL